MSVLIFPNDPTEGQVYPPDPIPGVNQYFWDEGSETWVQLPACLTPEGVILVDTGVGLIGGPITYQGIIEIDDTGVEPGSYTSANITVNAQGQITEASDGSAAASLAVETFVYTTGLLGPGESEQFEINIGRSYQLLSILTDRPVWIRIYGNPYVRNNDTRVAPGPTLPSPSRGFFAEFVTSGPELLVSPVAEIQSSFVNSYFTVEVLPSDTDPASEVTITIQAIPFVVGTVPPLTCSEPPFYCSIDIDPFCVTDFSNAWDGCEDLIIFPLLNINAGTNFSNAWRNCINLTNFPAGMFDSCLAVNFTGAWLNCSLSQQSVDNILISLDAAGQSNGTLSISGGLSAVPSATGNAAKLALEGKGWNVTVNEPLPYIYCTPLVTYQPVSYPPYFCNTDVNTLGVTSFYEAWYDCELITSFPCIRSASVTDFSYAWEYCYGLTSFPNINTGSGTNFAYTWGYCSYLETFPLINTSMATSFYGTWSGCYTLGEIPLLDSGNVSNFDYTWYDCQALTSFPLMNVSSGTTFNGTWRNCHNLTFFPTLNTSSGTNFSEAWQACYSLTLFPTLNTSSGTNFSFAWADCTTLISFPQLDFGSGTNFSSAWSGCTSLATFTASTFDTCPATSFSNAWNNCALDETSVDNILVSLDAAGQSGGTVDVSGGTSSAPGVSGLAAKLSLEGKGWTVLTN